MPDPRFKANTEMQHRAHIPFHGASHFLK